MVHEDVVVKNNTAYCVKYKYYDADIIRMVEYLIDNIYVEFDGRVNQSADCWYSKGY